MKFKFFLFNFILFFIFTPVRSFAEPQTKGKQDLIQADSFVYDYITALTMETGNISLCDQAPVSINEIYTYLKAIDYENLSNAGKNAYDSIIESFTTNQLVLESDIIKIGFRPSFNLEGYYKSNENIDWIYRYNQRKPLIDVPFFVNIGDYISMETDLAFGQNKGQRLHHKNYINIPFSVNQMDINFPSYGYLSTGYDFTDSVHLNLQLGMGPQSVGRSATGSMIMSEYFTGASYLNMEIFSPNIKYNMNVTQFNVDKYMYTHRFDFRFFRKVQFLMSESILVYAPLELRFLNPLTVFHGYTPWLDYSPAEDYREYGTCAYMCFGLSYTPVKYLRLYGLFAQDQFQTKYERDNWPEDSTPNAIGTQLGIESFIPYTEGYFHTWIEGSYADPFLYIKEDPNSSLVRTYRENMGDLSIFYEWVCSPFGPDTISGEFNFGYTIPSKAELTLTYLFMAKGEYSGNKVFTDALDWGGFDTVPGNRPDGKPDVTEWAYPSEYKPGGLEEAKRRQALIAPSGIPEYVNRISLFGSYTPVKFITINSQIGYVYILNFDNQYGVNKSGFELTCSVNLKLPDFHTSSKNLMY